MATSAYMLTHCPLVRFRTRIAGDNSIWEVPLESRDNPVEEPAGEGAHVRLRDGAKVLVRPVRPDDRPLFVAGFERMSEESRYRRFFSHKKKLSERELDFFTNLDHRRHEAIGAIDESTGEGIGVARMHVSEGDPELAEAAVTVVDDWQGRGLGSLLLDRLTARARELGVHRFEASLLTGHRAMLTLFDQLGCMTAHHEAPDVMTIDVELPVAEEDEALGVALKSVAEGHAAVAPRSD
jgi:RimJ/RimL family protein N-acetyltransferase